MWLEKGRTPKQGHHKQKAQTPKTRTKGTGTGEGGRGGSRQTTNNKQQTRSQNLFAADFLTIVVNKKMCSQSQTSALRYPRPRKPWHGQTYTMCRILWQAETQFIATNWTPQKQRVGGIGHQLDKYYSDCPAQPYIHTYIHTGTLCKLSNFRIFQTFNFPNFQICQTSLHKWLELPLLVVCYN